MMNLFWLSSAALLASASAFAPTNNGGSIIANSRSINAVAALQMSNDDTWYEDDTVVTLVPKFKIKEGMKEQYVELLPKFVELVKANEAESCVHYGFVSIIIYVSLFLSSYVDCILLTIACSIYCSPLSIQIQTGWPIRR